MSLLWNICIYSNRFISLLWVSTLIDLYLCYGIFVSTLIDLYLCYGIYVSRGVVVERTVSRGIRGGSIYTIYCTYLGLK